MIIKPLILYLRLTRETSTSRGGSILHVVTRDSMSRISMRGGGGEGGNDKDRKKETPFFMAPHPS